MVKLQTGNVGFWTGQAFEFQVVQVLLELPSMLPIVPKKLVLVSLVIAGIVILLALSAEGLMTTLLGSIQGKVPYGSSSRTPAAYLGLHGPSISPSGS